MYVCVCLLDHQDIKQALQLTSLPNPHQHPHPTQPTPKGMFTRANPDLGACFRKRVFRPQSSNLNAGLPNCAMSKPEFLVSEHSAVLMNSDIGHALAQGYKKPYQWNADNVIHHGNK